MCCGNDCIMVCGIFVNIRICNFLVFGMEGGWICYFFIDKVIFIYEVVMLYVDLGMLFVVFVGVEYGMGLS